MAGTVPLQERIAAMMHNGASLDRVEKEVIEPSALTPDQKAALWLYAWLFVDGSEPSDQARRLRAVGG